LEAIGNFLSVQLPPMANPEKKDVSGVLFFSTTFAPEKALYIGEELCRLRGQIKPTEWSVSFF
jgi:hypothetical protein